MLVYTEKSLPKEKGPDEVRSTKVCVLVTAAVSYLHPAIGSLLSTGAVRYSLV